MTATLTAPVVNATAAKEGRSYVRFIRVKMDKEQADQWDTLSKQEIDEISEPYQADVIESFEVLLEKKAERLKAQEELMAEIPEGVLAKAKNLGLTLNLTAA